MGWSEMEGRCRRHPKHRQSKGVCPSCLRERLSQLSASSSTHNSNFSSLGSSYDSATSSAPSSSPGTPSATQSHGRRDATAKIALLMKEKGENPLLGRGPEPLTKSRSLAFVISNPLGGGKKKAGKAGDDEEDTKKKSKEEEGKQQQEEKKTKKGFWSKLAVGGKKSKQKDGLFHSRTVRETSSARWTFLP